MNQQLQQDMAAYGITEDMLPAHIRKPADCEVWEEHSESVAMFLRCSTQWRTGPDGIVGLDYGVLLPMMDLFKVADQQAMIDDLQIMEHRALELFHKKTK
jgi:hypothetical protein